MSALFPVFAFILVLTIVMWVYVLSKGAGRGQLPYMKKATLFSPAERSFLGVLDNAVPAGYRVFGKVRIADVMDVRKLTNRKAWQVAFNRISSKHFDYVVCKADDLSIVLVVELDDKSHGEMARKKRDVFVDGACGASGLPLLRVPARNGYALADIRSQVAQLLQPQGDGIPQVEKQSGAVTSSGTADAAGPIAPSCPKCSSRMQLRKLTSGAKAGSSFWGCDNFPSCRGTIAATAAEPA